MKKLFFIFIGILCLLPLHAQTKAEADSAYAEKKYDEAISLYTSLLRKGMNADIYYNLGNSYYKTDRMAEAILNYERAALLDPGNSDIRFNLELARSKTIDQITPASEMFFVTWSKDVVNLLGADGWAHVGVIAFVCACVLALLFFMGNKVAWKKIGLLGAFVMLIVVVFANIFAWRQHEELNVRTGAVVMSSSVSVKSTPNESGTDLFVLHEGTRVEVIDDSMKDWKEIQLADGKVGWMPTKAMERI
ncbi:MAG: tetratricopeptide repeat protein [Paraprevotella sp.]|nr:tetratricopeptide repeat protein [Paraprevotella sp.]